MPRIKTKQLMVRGNTDRTWRTIPAAGTKVYPVAQTDEMTQPVGRDAQGRLWTSAGGGSGNISVTYDDTTGELTIASSAGGVAYDEETGNLTIGG